MNLEDKVISYIEKLPNYLKVIIFVAILAALFLFFLDMHN